MKDSPLGKKSKYIDTYTPSLLFSIPRKVKRDEIGMSEKLLFMGRDIWNAYELSWLNAKGKPQVAMGEFSIPATSKNLIESKSFKLYLNSFNQSVRQHNEFHEQCVERIFMDILRRCAPHKLTVYARYVRRGGLDINPIRTTEFFSITNQRLFRQ